jgi:hypothetical protein
MLYTTLDSFSGLRYKSRPVPVVPRQSGPLASQPLTRQLIEAFITISQRPLSATKLLVASLFVNDSKVS